MKKEEFMEQVKNALKDESVLNGLKTLETAQDIYGFLTKEKFLTASYEEFIELGKSLSIAELLNDDDLENVVGGCGCDGGGDGGRDGGRDGGLPTFEAYDGPQEGRIEMIKKMAEAIKDTGKGIKDLGKGVKDIASVFKPAP